MSEVYAHIFGKEINIFSKYFLNNGCELQVCKFCDGKNHVVMFKCHYGEKIDKVTLIFLIFYSVTLKIKISINKVIILILIASYRLLIGIK